MTFKKAIHDLIKEYAIENQKIIFNGDGYSQAWVEERKEEDFQTLSLWLSRSRRLYLISR